jgi:hypothetical protein
LDAGASVHTVNTDGESPISLVRTMDVESVIRQMVVQSDEQAGQ